MSTPPRPELDVSQMREAALAALATAENEWFRMITPGLAKIVGEGEAPPLDPDEHHGIRLCAAASMLLLALHRAQGDQAARVLAAWPAWHKPEDRALMVRLRERLRAGVAIWTQAQAELFDAMLALAPLEHRHPHRRVRELTRVLDASGEELAPADPREPDAAPVRPENAGLPEDARIWFVCPWCDEVRRGPYRRCLVCRGDLVPATPERAAVLDALHPEFAAGRMELCACRDERGCWRCHGRGWLRRGTVPLAELRIWWLSAADRNLLELEDFQGVPPYVSRATLRRAVTVGQGWLSVAEEFGDLALDPGDPRGQALRDQNRAGIVIRASDVGPLPPRGFVTDLSWRIVPRFSADDAGRKPAIEVFPPDLPEDGIERLVRAIARAGVLVEDAETRSLDASAWIDEDSGLRIGFACEATRDRVLRMLAALPADALAVELGRGRPETARPAGRTRREPPRLAEEEPDWDDSP